MKIKELAEFFNRQVELGQGEIEVKVSGAIPLIAYPIEDVTYKVFCKAGENERRILLISADTTK